MTEDIMLEQRKRLVQLIREIAKEKAWLAIDEHLDACMGKRKPLGVHQREGV
jgi:hypothetical protein